VQLGELQGAGKDISSASLDRMWCSSPNMR